MLHAISVLIVQGNHTLSRRSSSRPTRVLISPELGDLLSSPTELDSIFNLFDRFIIFAMGITSRVSNQSGIVQSIYYLESTSYFQYARLNPFFPLTQVSYLLSLDSFREIRYTQTHTERKRERGRQSQTPLEPASRKTDRNYWY